MADGPAVPSPTATARFRSRPPALTSPAAAPAAPARRTGRPRVDPRIWGALAFAVGAGAVLRFWGLGAHRFGFDDAFTTMAARMPVGQLFGYLRANDSHPPLDYLLRIPLSHLTTSEWWLRFPSVACSVGALTLFAWWMRTRGWIGVLATALFAVSAFQVLHGRQVRMYPELELIGVAAAMLAESWLERPRRWHARAVGALTLICLLLHVSGFLLGAGLLALAGRRTDREAWRWRAALAIALGAWAVLWGPSFVTQTQGGHSDWIPRTTLHHLVDTVGRLVTAAPHLYGVICIAGVAGAVLLVRSDRRLGRVWLCCVAVPIALAAASGAVAPVLLDRTLTVAAWGPVLAVAYLVGGIARRSRVLATVAVIAVAAVMIPAGIHVVTARSTPDVALRHLDAVVQPGDVVAIRPRVKEAELTYTIGVRAHRITKIAHIDGLSNTAGVAVMASTNDADATPMSGRIWLLDWNRRPIETGYVQCAAPWHRGTARVLCLTRAGFGAPGPGN
jgi:hypothetical protein